MWLVILEGEQSLAHQWVVTAPLGQRFVIGPEAWPVALCVVIGTESHALVYVTEPVLRVAVILQELGEGTEDAPFLQLPVQILVDHG